MLFPPFMRVLFFKLVARIVYIINKRHRFIIHANLDFAFNNSMSINEKNSIAKNCFTTLFLEILTIIESYYLSVDTMNKRISIKGLDIVEKLHKTNKPIVFFTAHLNNIELGAIAFSQVTQSVQTVQEASNPFIHAFITKARENGGLKIVTMKRAIRAQVQQLQANKDVQFFKHRTLHGTAASKLVRKFDAHLMPFMLLEDEEGKPQLTFFEPLEYTFTDNEKEDVQALTQLQATFTENIIRENVTSWFWCHKRWKTTNPELYKRK